MSRLLGMLFALIGYFCTATTIAVVLGLGYLWHTDRLTNDKMFRMVALLHDVDLNQIAELQHKPTDEVPAEELSLTNVSHRQQVLDRNAEVKLLALQRGRQEFDHRLQQLKEQTGRYDRLAQDWESRLKQQEQLASQENVAKVVSDLEQVKPAIGKELLIKYIDEGNMNDAILLMSKMSESKLAKILKTFSTEEELDQLHEIHEQIIKGGDKTSQLEKALGELKNVEAGS